MSIFDLAPPTEIIEVGGEQQEIRPIGLAETLQIMARFPALSELIAGGKRQVTFVELLSSGAVPAIIASGCSRHGEAEAEKKIALLDADTQATLLIPILRLTMPRGVVPFLTRVTEFMVVLSPSPTPTREDLAQKVLAKHLRKSSPPSSSNTEVPSPAIAS